MLEKLEKYYADGLLIKQTHPTKDLTIWNYSQKVQYEKLWDDITMQCRGLVTNSKGQIIARPFRKFFNLEELDSLPNGDFKVYEKMDGSLGVLFDYENEWILASRGSFTSEQAVKGTEMLKKHNLESLQTGYTYLFEIIYPENRIVVNYGSEEKLILIGIVHSMIDDFEMPLEYCDGLLGDSNFEIVKSYNLGDNIESLKNTISNDNEGYVLRFNTRPITRIKIKGEEYVRLHRIITNVSNRDVWELLKNGKPLDELLEKVPDEFYNWVKNTVIDLQNKFDSTKSEVEEQFKELINKKEFAEKIKDNPNKSFLFKRLDSYSNQLNDMIWDSIYPTYSKPFKQDEN